MEGASDLTRATLEQVLPGRALRTYPAMLSTEAEALSWARRGAPHGAVVVAGYQASPRGRSGLSWDDLLEPGHGLGASVIVHPELPEHREGWLYTLTLQALVDALDGSALRIEWPDNVMRGDAVAAAVGVQVGDGHPYLDWAVINIAVPGAEPPRSGLLARILEALDARLAQDSEQVLAASREVCQTIGRVVSARMLPLGAAAPSIDGTAVDLTDDGGLAIRTEENLNVVVLPQAIGFLVDPETDPKGPDRNRGEAAS